MQNKDGGFASYELIRGPAWLEWLNVAQVFGKIMIEYSYTECTTAVLLGLKTFQKYYPTYRSEDISRVSNKAVAFIRAQQAEDGSWYGSWAICYTYAMFFALESLASAGDSYETSDSVRKACLFLVEHQMEDGGWGESYTACETHTWCDSETSQVVQTAWALLALMAAGYPDQTVLKRGVQVVLF